MIKYSREDLEAKLLDVVAKVYEECRGKEVDLQITPDTDIRKELKYDSIMLIVLQINIEDTFHIRFDPIKTDFQKIFTTVRAMGNYVQEFFED